MEDDKTPPDSLDTSETLKQDTDCSNSNTPSPSYDAVELFDEAVEEDVLLHRSPTNVFTTNVNEDAFYSHRRLTFGNNFNEWPDDKSSIPTAVIGAGLANLGNTCFLNAVLQCFTHTVPLLRGILADTSSVNCDCNKEKFCLLCTLRELIEVTLTLKNRVVFPSNLVDNLSYFSSTFQRFQQEDAHEFLQCFLDRLESSYDARRRNKMSLQTDNLVKQVFGGRLVSKLKCCNCGHCSDTYEPSVDLSLEIEDADNLLTALQSFTKVEKIDDPFTCDKCKEQVSVEKQLTIDQLPSVAAFHLKRFKNEGHYVQKIDKPVSFPKELDLLPFTCSGRKDDAELKYILYAILVHTGHTSTSGHYYCFIRLSPDMWCKFDDSRVVQVHEDLVLSQEAYILFYAKEGTPWFSSFIETQKLCADTMTMSTSPKSVLENVDTSLSPALQKNVSCNSNEVSEASVSKQWRIQENEIKDSSPRLNELENNKSTFNLHRTSDLSAPTNGSLDVSLRKSRKEVSPILLKKVILTPPRSPSPEIYIEDPPDAGFSIPLDHLRLTERKSCKRKLVKDDLETKHACSYIKKKMQGLRGKQIFDSMRGSQSEGSVSKKKSRVALSKGDNSVPRLRPLISR
ncbi:hypothetical protein ACJIZ3_003834 [Penstemon smallii]|uniref:Ubiquitin carboxyl-terminal hydrolase n=1 Tax=Penstemon smallii TaxID=265156 RepID=A0ABD3S0B1_9LAMI